MKRKRYLWMMLMLCFIGISRFEAHGQEIVEDSRDTVKIPIVMYHSVNPKGLGTYKVTPQKFKKDLKAYRKAGFTTIHFKELSGLYNNPF